MPTIGPTFLSGVGLESAIQAGLSWGGLLSLGAERQRDCFGLERDFFRESLYSHGLALC